MSKKIARILAVVLLAAMATTMIWAQSPDPCAPTAFKLGPTNPKNGFPLWVEDSRGVRVELCLDGDGSTGACFYDPVEPGNLYSQQVGFGPEAFWFLADAEMLSVEGGFTFALEAAWAAEVPNPGDQFPFIRFRYRFDALPALGKYTLLHPWGREDFDALVWDADKNRVDRIVATYDTQFRNDGTAKGVIGPLPVPTTIGSPYIATGTYQLPAAGVTACGRRTLRLSGTYVCVDSDNNGTTDDGMLMNTCLTTRQGQPINFGGGATFVETDTFTMVSGKVATRVGVETLQTAYVKTGTLKGVEVFAKAVPMTGQSASLVNARVEGTVTDFPMSSDPKGRYFVFIPDTFLPGGFAGTTNSKVTVINASDANEDGLVTNQQQSRVTTTMTDVVDIRTTYWWKSGINANKLEIVAKNTNTVDACPVGAWGGITGSSTVKLKAFHQDGEFIADLATATAAGWSAFYSTTTPPHKVIVRSCFGGDSEADVEVGIPVTR